MKVLDCETKETTIKSVCNILDLQEESLISFLRKATIPDNINTSSDSYLLQLLIKSIEKKAIHIDRICWFHLTRTFDGNDFRNGIKDLGSMLLPLNEKLYYLVHPKLSFEEWMKRLDNASSSRYALKTSDIFYFGPYAMLVRESSFRFDRLGNHDYLGVPEIVEDIEDALGKGITKTLVRKFRRKTKPTIVKFVQDENGHGLDCLSTALLYLYGKFHKEQMNWMANSCFDGKGKSIEPGSVLKIENVSAQYYVTISFLRIKMFFLNIYRIPGRIRCRKVARQFELWFQPVTKWEMDMPDSREPALKETENEDTNQTT